MVCLAAPAAAEDGSLTITSARARFDAHRTTGTPRHSLKLKGTFPSLDDAHDFDATTDALHVAIGRQTVLDVPAASDPGGFRFRRRRGALRKWRYRVKGEAGQIGTRTFSINVRTGRFKLTAKKANLLLLRDGGAADLETSLTIGDLTSSTSLTFLISPRGNPVRWSFRDIPPPPPKPGPVAFTSVVSSSLPNTNRPHVEVARTQAELDVMWRALGSPGTAPTVDFDQDMVVTVSALVHGPGQFPPILDVIAVRDRGGLEIDWRLSLCEENVCPGAPIPCPTATPFHVFVTRQTTGTPSTFQKATLGVCP